MKLLEKFKKNKKISVLIIIIILLGLFLRFNDYGQESFHGDCMAYFSPALFWFYPHDYYPGLSGMGEPALGHFFIGLGCLASGEDFSGVTETQPMFYPGREILFGKEIVNAERYCHIPIYIFGLLFFITIVIFALVLLDLYSAAYFIGFFAFSLQILRYSRWMQLNIFVFFFSILGLLFLWKAYTAEKATKKELIFFILSSIGFALAFSSKLPAVMYLILLIFLLLEKYKDEILFIFHILFQNLGLNLLSKYKQSVNLKSLIKISLASILAFASVLFITFEFSFMNIFRVIQQYRSHSGDINAIGINLHFYQGFTKFLYNVNSLDMLIFFFSIYILIRLIFKKERTKLEKFILYSLCLLIFLTLTFQIITMLQRAFSIFFFGLILLMALTFSNKNYSIIKLLKFSKKNLFFIFMIIYVVHSFSIAFSDSPYFHSPPNKLLCMLTTNEETFDNYCRVTYTNDRDLAEFMGSLLEEDETFLPSGFINHYLRHEEHLTYYMFRQTAISQLHREPTLEEYIQYYKPLNRTVRYIIVSPNSKDIQPLNLGPEYEPNYRIKIKGIDSKWIYDLQNLTKRK